MVSTAVNSVAVLLFLQTCVYKTWATPASAKISSSSTGHSSVTKASTALSSNTRIPTSHAAPPTYRLDTEFNASNFFDEFDFFTGSDPTHGFVKYEDKQDAFRLNLAKTTDVSVPGLHSPTNVVHLAAQSGAISSSSAGRSSVRVTSRRQFPHGLFISDFAHLPQAECGIWPAFWTGSINAWPNGGEIDIVEGVNLQTNNEVVLHTGKKCSMASDNDKMTGVPGLPDCDNADGCTVKDGSSNSYGEAFNKGGGGVYAMEWTNKSIKVWWWARNAVPEDIRSGKPSPRGWPDPVASFSNAGCDIDKLFKDHQIIFDITFCGDWAGKPGIWNQACAASHGPTCSSYVLNSKSGFKTAYWDILSLKVYQAA